MQLAILFDAERWIPPQAAVISLGAVSILLFILTLRGLPRGGEVRGGSRPLGDKLFHLVLGILSISLLAVSGMTRDLLQKIEPFSSSTFLYEVTCGVAAVMAVSPLLAILATGFRAAEPASAPKASVINSTSRALARFAMAYIPFLLLQACVLWAVKIFNIPAPPQGMLVTFHEQAIGVQLAMIFSIGIAVPIAEEVVFRGTLQPAVSRLFGPELARLSVAVLFGMLHGEIAAVPIGIFGYFLSRVRDAWGSIVPCIVIHSINNILALIFYASCPYIRELYH
ncbi:MAG: lysostaphin resistance A-like protein [Planctomycetota bacterium]